MTLGRKRKQIINKFQMIIYNYTDDGVFTSVNRPFRGSVIIDLKKLTRLRSIMVGRSTNVHSSEVGHDYTRIGKQMYIESVRTLFGDEDCQKSYLHAIGERVYEFDMQDNLPSYDNDDIGDTASSATRLSWTNLKAVLVDGRGRTTFADVIVKSIEEASRPPSRVMLNGNSKVDGEVRYSKTNHPNRTHHPGNMITTARSTNGNNPKSQQRNRENNDHGSRMTTSDMKERLMMDVNYRSEASQNHSFLRRQNLGVGVESIIDVKCKLKKSVFCADESVSFVIQCENNMKRGCKHITASLIERRSNNIITRSSKQRRRLPTRTVTASLIGPPVGPKELVVWEGQLTPGTYNASNECWYTLRIEVATKFFSKQRIEIPVIIAKEDDGDNNDGE